MKTLIKRLPIMAFILAAFAAFAFSTSPTPEYGHDGSAWINVTGLTPGATTYQCNNSELVCTRETASPTGTPVKYGIFKNNMP